MEIDLKGTYVLLEIELTKKKDQRDIQYLRNRLILIEQQHYKEPEAKKLQTRIFKYRGELLTCLNYDNVMPHNNVSERVLRNQVVMRKIFGGSRSLDGA